MGWRWFVAEEASLGVFLGAETVRVDVLAAGWCGGRVTGSVQIDHAAESDKTERCQLELQVEDADLSMAVDIYRDLKAEDLKTYEGTLSGHLTLSGTPGPQFLYSATGSGGLTVEDGYILSIPVLGGLSKHLSLLVPGLGYASQRDFRGTFTIDDGTLETKDSQLLGRLVSIRGVSNRSLAGEAARTTR